MNSSLQTDWTFAFASVSQKNMYVFTSCNDLFSVLMILLLDSRSSVPMEAGSSLHDTTNTKLEISYAAGRAATHSTVTNISQIKDMFWV